MLNRFKKIFSKKEPPSVFGKPLEELPMNSNGIPIFFEIVCSKILNNVTHKGIFRKCGEQNQVELIGQLAVNPDFQLPPSTDVDILTSFLKKWLRELPESILIPPIVKKYFNPNDPSTGPTTLQNLPPINRKCLAILFNIIKLISNNSDINLMPMNNLFVCVVPSIIQFAKTPDFGNNFSFQSIYASTIHFLNDEGTDFDFQRQIETRPLLSPNNKVRANNFRSPNSNQKRKAVNFNNYNPRRNMYRTCNEKMMRHTKECPLIDSGAAAQLQSCPEMCLNTPDEIQEDDDNPPIQPFESLPIPIYDDGDAASKENSDNSQEEKETKHHKKSHKKHNKKHLEDNNNNKKSQESDEKIEEAKSSNNSNEKLLENNEKLTENNNKSTDSIEKESKPRKKHHKKHSKNSKKTEENNQKELEENGKSEDISDDILQQNSPKPLEKNSGQRSQEENFEKVENIEEDNEDEKSKDDDDDDDDE